MSYLETKRYKSWRKDFWEYMDRIYSRGAPPEPDDEKHAEFRTAAIELFRKHLRGLEEYRDKPDPVEEW